MQNDIPGKPGTNVQRLILEIGNSGFLEEGGIEGVGVEGGVQGEGRGQRPVGEGGMRLINKCLEWARNARCGKHPQSLAPGAALGPPKLGGPREAAHCLEREVPLASLTLYTPLGRQTMVSDSPPRPQGPLRAFSEAGERRPGYKPQDTKIP